MCLGISLQGYIRLNFLLQGFFWHNQQPLPYSRRAPSVTVTWTQQPPASPPPQVHVKPDSFLVAKTLICSLVQGESGDEFAGRRNSPKSKIWSIISSRLWLNSCARAVGWAMNPSLLSLKASVNFPELGRWAIRSEEVCAKGLSSSS